MEDGLLVPLRWMAWESVVQVHFTFPSQYTLLTHVFATRPIGGGLKVPSTEKVRHTAPLLF